jgi:hypothetical protein
VRAPTRPAWFSHSVAILVPMEPESASSTDTALPGQREEPSDSQSAASDVLIPTPRQVESELPERQPAADQIPGAFQAPAPLSARERAVLGFEKQQWQSTGAKEQAIRERFEVSASRYYQTLNALLDRPEALAAEPVLVNRLRRKRDARRQASSSHRGESHGGDAV